LEARMLMVKSKSTLITIDEDIPLANENTLLIKGINEKAVVFL
jgi:hypothetical protein